MWRPRGELARPVASGESPATTELKNAAFRRVFRRAYSAPASSPLAWRGSQPARARACGGALSPWLGAPEERQGGARLFLRAGAGSGPRRRRSSAPWRRTPRPAPTRRSSTLRAASTRRPSMRPCARASRGATQTPARGTGAQNSSAWPFVFGIFG